VLLNYQGRADDVATMAHELGHAIHSMLAAHHSAFTQPLLPAAGRDRLHLWRDDAGRPPAGRRDDESVRRDMLFRQVDDAYATIMRQSFFALFEKQAHEMVVRMPRWMNWPPPTWKT
jgi:oligoendopeptidase F